MAYVTRPDGTVVWDPSSGQKTTKQQLEELGQGIRRFGSGPTDGAPRQAPTIKQQLENLGQGIRSFGSGTKPSASGVMMGTGATPPSATQLAGYSPFDYRDIIDPVTGLKKEDVDTNSKVDTVVDAEPTTDWTQLFAQFRAAGVEAAEASRLARQQAAENTYAAQLRSAQTAARQNQMAVQQARQQISEQSFEQQRALTQGAQSRGLGGSGIEQLARTQQRMGTGQNINQLVQQEMLGNEKLQNFLSDVEAKKGEKLAEADAQYYNDLFKIAGNDLDNVKYLDSIEHRNKVLAWQEKNAQEITDNNNLNTEIDLIKILEDPTLSDTGKKSTIAIMLQGEKITQQKADDLLDQYLGAAAGDRIVKGKFDWTTAIAAGALVAVGIAAAVAFAPLLAGTSVAAGLTAGITGAAAVGKGAAVLGGVKAVTGAAAAATAGGVTAGAAAGGISGLIERLSGNVSYRLSTGENWKGTRAEAIDKNNPNSVVVREFGTRQAFKDMQFALEGTEVKIIYQGISYDRFNDAQAAWLRQQGR